MYYIARSYDNYSTVFSFLRVGGFLEKKDFEAQKKWNAVAWRVGNEKVECGARVGLHCGKMTMGCSRCCCKQ